jgi:hypothetical protein
MSGDPYFNGYFPENYLGDYWPTSSTSDAIFSVSGPTSAVLVLGTVTAIAASTPARVFVSIVSTVQADRRKIHGVVVAVTGVTARLRLRKVRVVAEVVAEVAARRAPPKRDRHAPPKRDRRLFRRPPPAPVSVRAIPTSLPWAPRSIPPSVTVWADDDGDVLEMLSLF